MRIPVLQKKVWFGLVVAAAIAGGSTAALLYNNKIANEPSATIQPTPTISPIPEQRVTIYWIESKEKRFVAVPMPVKTANTETALKTALATMMAEPTKQPGFYSAIPTGTKVLDFTIKDKNIQLNLSKEFTSGGGSASVIGRVVQVLYTSTSLDPDAKLFLSVEGKPLTYLGGEGLEIQQPITRKDFALEF
ncbi:GerMN domain-containing protein [Pseudanabaena sp. PCC 6802]|uniref:GerMN domain-containing protein n=1 Tax=Pseudanabaena sp. PCC 6802 TaxID=118173 RepID=UPI0003460D28|nr:GerMN domain-containing protein [Pseudanabaena sp. PCC 6802]